MEANLRRTQIKLLLEKADSAISASSLAAKFEVSRQIVVGDIALLRASGSNIVATPKGYIVNKQQVGLRKLIPCKHGLKELTAELYAFVDNGGTVVNVSIEHPLYGQLTGNLNLSNRYDVDCFVEKTKKLQAAPLSLLTDGVHLHEVIFPNENAYKRCVNELSSLHILYE